MSFSTLPQTSPSSCKLCCMHKFTFPSKPLQHEATADYILTAQVLSYASTTHVKYDGFCCLRSCTQPCNNRFKFCLRPHGMGTGNDTCPTEEYVTGDISNDNMTFSLGRELDEGVPNPLVFTGKSWPVSLHNINTPIQKKTKTNKLIIISVSCF